MENCYTEEDNSFIPWHAKVDWLVELLSFFFLFFVFTWIIYYSLAPAVLLTNTGQIDTAKVLIAALITAGFLVICLGVFRYLINADDRYYKLENVFNKCVSRCESK
jgi:divalent metal cation (Fe/Co/Zn/Cd) transporter